MGAKSFHVWGFYIVSMSLSMHLPFLTCLLCNFRHGCIEKKRFHRSFEMHVEINIIYTLILKFSSMIS